MITEGIITPKDERATVIDGYGVACIVGQSQDIELTAVNRGALCVCVVGGKGDGA